MKRLVLLVEGHGDVTAVPTLAAKVLADLPVEFQGHSFVDPAAIRIGGLEKFTGRLRQKWHTTLELALLRPNVGGILLVVDGDSDEMEDAAFCALDAARALSERTKQTGAGTIFSLAIVFLQKEFESILISAAGQLPGIVQNYQLPPVIEGIRDAKGWLDKYLIGGYDPVRDQNNLTKAVKDWEGVRSQHRSFRRFESAIRQTVSAIALGVHKISLALLVPQSSGTTA